MNGTVTIGSEVVEMSANAASPYFYKRVFNEDFLLKTQESPVDVFIFTKMGFIMAMTAEKSLEDLCKLKEADFLKWCERFAPMDIMSATQDIATIYTAQERGASAPKKEEG